MISNLSMDLSGQATPIPSSPAPLIPASSYSEPLPSLRRRIPAASFFESKSLPQMALPEPSKPDMKEAPLGLYLTDTQGVPKLNGFALKGEKDLHCASHNVLHPFIALAQTNPENRKNSRFSMLAEQFARHQIELINTQESTQKAVHTFVDEGYHAVSADRIDQHSMRSANPDTTSLLSAIEPLEEAPPPTIDPIHFSTLRKKEGESLWKSSWKGLTSYFNPSTHELTLGKTPDFFQYDQNRQKSWSHIAGAVGNFLISLSNPTNFTLIKRRAIDVINSCSGVARTDGLLVTYLNDKDSGLPVVLCNTHLESFDHDIRKMQIEQLIQTIKTLQQNNPNAAIIIAGDFNYPQLNKFHQGHFCTGLSHIFQQTLGASTMDQHQIEPTIFGGVDIDGIYFLPPKNFAIKDIQGATYLPTNREKPNVHWSDHKAVVVNTRITPTGHSLN